MLRSDLCALRNLFATREGIRVVVAQTIVLACIASGSLAMAGLLLGRREVRDAVRAHLDGDVVRTLHALVMLLPLLFVAASGTASFRSELYSASHVPGLLVAPVSSLAIVLRAFVRSLFGWSMFAVAAVLPPTLRLADGLPWPASPPLALAAIVATVSLLAPLLACQLLLRVVIVRWGSGARLRWILQAVNVAVFFTITLTLVFGFVRGKEVAAATASWLGTAPSLPWILDAPASLAAAVAGYPQNPARLLSPLLLLALCVPPLLAAAAIYRRSYDVYCSSTNATVVARARSRVWPETPLRSLLAKVRAETVRVGSNLGGYVFLATLLVLILAQGMTLHEFEARVPIAVRETFFLLANWHGLALLVATVSFLGVVGSEQKQITLLSTSPLPRKVIVHARLVAVSLPFVAILLVTAICGPLIAGVGLSAVAGFLAVAPALLLYLLGVILAVGTWPRFIRVHDDMPLANNLRSIAPVMVIGMCGVLSLVLQVKARAGVVASYYGHGVFAPHDGGTVAVWLVVTTWVVGAAVFAIGYRLAIRNTERLLAAQA